MLSRSSLVSCSAVLTMLRSAGFFQSGRLHAGNGATTSDGGIWWWEYRKT